MCVCACMSQDSLLAHAPIANAARRLSISKAQVHCKSDRYIPIKKRDQKRRSKRPKETLKQTYICIKDPLPMLLLDGLLPRRRCIAKETHTDEKRRIKETNKNKRRR